MCKAVIFLCNHEQKLDFARYFGIIITIGGMNMLLKLDLAKPLGCDMFGRMMQRNGWNRKYTHTNKNHLLVFVISGSAIFHVDGERISLSVGDMLVIPAGIPYNANTDCSCEYYFFRFCAALAPTQDKPEYPAPERSISFTVSGVPHRTVVFSAKTSLQEDYQKLYQSIIACAEFNSGGTFSQRLALDLELSKILLLLAQIEERKTNAAPYPLIMEQMLAYIRKHLTEPLITSDVCRNCGISASYGARLFRQYFGMTITSYIASEKLYYACELMNSTGMNISQIAAYLGFCDVYYFSKCFKKKFGKAPTKLFFRE